MTDIPRTGPGRTPRWRLLSLFAIPLLAAAALLWSRGSGHAEPSAVAPPPAVAADAVTEPAPGAEAAPLAAPPAPSPKTREEQRFARADRDDDGLISQAEYLVNRRRNFDKLDSNGDGRLSFDEYATEGITKFATADSNRNGVLDSAEFATTAAKPKASKPACACG